MSVKCIVPGLILSLALIAIAADNNGFLVGHLRILSLKEVERADEGPSKPFAKNYSDYPLIVLSQDGKKEITRITADGEGNYRVELPAGAYILDVQGRGRGHLRAKPQPFTVAANQTVQVDLDVDTGVR